MSRTDIHRPYWVQTADPGNRRHLRANHHHWRAEHWDPELGRHLVQRSAGCDLGQRGGWCTWWPAARSNRFCGCYSCTDQRGRRRSARADRAAARQQLATARQYTAAGDRSIDVDVPPRRVWKW